MDIKLIRILRMFFENNLTYEFLFFKVRGVSKNNHLLNRHIVGVTRC